MNEDQLRKLRLVINENLRVQRGGADPIPYIDVANVLNDVGARQNHAIFARRGCGKTLLLDHSGRHLPANIKRVYLNCEDFKRHSFPNVLLEILDALFAELSKHVTGWFGKKRRCKELIVEIRNQLKELREADDQREEEVRESQSSGGEDKQGYGLSAGAHGVKANLEETVAENWKSETERKYIANKSKIRELDIRLPRIKQLIRQLFELSSHINSVYIHIDDFYHLPRADQPLIMDYVHRLCKDVPLYFKVATLRHASTLYADRKGQPIGAQERNDYQPVNIDFTFSEFAKTVEQNRKILREFGRL